MRYFSQETLDRVRSEDDDISDAAAEEWNRFAEACREHYVSIRHLLPPDLCRLHELCLHDAEFWFHLGSGCTRDGVEQWTAGYRLEDDPGVPGHTLEGHYRGGRAPLATIVIEAGAGNSFTPYVGGGVFVLYDEIEVVPDTQPPEFVHSLLLSDGQEVRFRFRDFALVEIDR